MELNKVELALKEIYDGWQLGNEKENNGYSAMFRMGFPDEYIDSGRPLLMYVGQECLDCTPTKTQDWIRKYQIVQRTKKPNAEIVRKTNRSPFWNFYRRLCEKGYDAVWNNLDKLHPINEQRLTREDGVDFNRPFGKEKMSVLQREIALLRPKVVVLTVGNGKYTASLASALSINEEALKEYEPSHEALVHDISHLLGFEDVTALWTYHPNHLQLSKNYRKALIKISDIILL
ncbi:MAG: hypothetical protein E7648_06435 [Ruminococcaceae bacterium]|nr:hypothetical protein [Oscillospiraceae bacterium]